jgi:DNA end-binding protein Ku
VPLGHERGDDSMIRRSFTLNPCSCHELIEGMADSFDPAKYKDTYTDEVQKLIEAKAKGQKRDAPVPKAAKGNVIDLVAALQESLGSVKKGKKRSAA